MITTDVLSGAGLKAAIPPEVARQNVLGLEYDSRKVGQGYLFFAFAGANVDGRRFAAQASEKGAAAVVSDLPAPDGVTAPWIEVESGRRALAVAARNFYGCPDQSVAITGITGTNGKTTTSFLLDSVLRCAGKTTALVGTIEYRLGTRTMPAPNTTPESLDIERILSELHGQGGTHATMEVSSHALAAGRVHALQFHTAVFTNLTQDHLDYHGTMESYFAAKKILFDGCGGPPPKFAVVNRDDEWGRRITASPGTELLSYGLGKEAALRARNVRSTASGVRFEVGVDGTWHEVNSPLAGKFNVLNILAAYGAAITYRVPSDTIARGIEACRGVPARFERIDEGQPFLVFVDYSHTDDALRNALTSARDLHPKRIVTVFGCGGDRDRTKRPLMGRVAAELSDVVVLTSDNPRSEDPIEIMNDVTVGIRRTDRKTIQEPDRRAAIRKAFEEARAGDLVMIAGKGHETYQIFRDRTVHFDDREEARLALRAFGFKGGAA